MSGLLGGPAPDLSMVVAGFTMLVLFSQAAGDSGNSITNRGNCAAAINSRCNWPVTRVVGNTVMVI